MNQLRHFGIRKDKWKKDKHYMLYDKESEEELGIVEGKEDVIKDKKLLQSDPRNPGRRIGYYEFDYND